MLSGVQLGSGLAARLRRREAEGRFSNLGRGCGGEGSEEPERRYRVDLVHSCRLDGDTLLASCARSFTWLLGQRQGNLGHVI